MKANIVINVKFGGQIKVDGARQIVCRDASNPNHIITEHTDRSVNKTIDFTGVTMDVTIQEELDITTKEYISAVKDVLVDCIKAFKEKAVEVIAPTEETKKEEKKEG